MKQELPACPDTGWSQKPVLDSMVQWVNNYRELQKIAD